MAELGYCSINNLQLSSESLDAVAEIKDIMEDGNMLAYSVGAVPLFDLFLGKQKPAETLISIAGYDWVEFSEVLSSVNSIVKNRINGIAEPLSWKTHGEEGEFWRCVSRATL
ncbi:hypothetical protein OPW36_06285 [Vibrio europaeus]|uniref:hypothetical protein n=1 Tax=Vibrio TaxID=662 RepID=UPI001F5BFDBE|nr:MULTISPECIES: hypothetical protein [Vibrio]MDC5824329.1 hypothetical protein [Vibrio europaeus]